MSGKMSRETKANEVIRKFEKNFATLKTEYERAQARVDLRRDWTDAQLQDTLPVSVFYSQLSDKEKKKVDDFRDKMSPLFRDEVFFSEFVRFNKEGDLFIVGEKPQILHVKEILLGI